MAFNMSEQVMRTFSPLGCFFVHLPHVMQKPEKHPKNITCQAQQLDIRQSGIWITTMSRPPEPHRRVSGNNAVT